jgi:hypothetical protein
MPSVIKHSHVQVDGTSAASASIAQPDAPLPKSCAKSVRPLLVGGVVRAFEVACSCGAVTVVELDYPEAP